MKKMVKNVLKKANEKFNRFKDIVALNSEINYLKKELEESKNKEKPYIDKIQALKSDNRVLKIINAKLENKNMKLEQEVARLKANVSSFFGE